MRSKKTLLVTASILLFAAQIYLVLKGTEVFGKYLNPVLIFISLLLLSACYISVVLSHNSALDTNGYTTGKYRTIVKWFSLLLGFATIAVWHNAIKKVFLDFDAYKYSDVIPQLEALYDRFARGEFPYKPVPQPGYEAYPVYMPLHWLPIVIPKLLHRDVRWVGILLLAIATAIYCYYVFKSGRATLFKLIAALLPSAALASFVLPHTIDMPVSLETVIAAYYLILATGLLSRNLAITTIGIILCLLSRYTLVFWLPLFFILLWLNEKKSKNAIVWLSILLSFLFIYVIPFYLKDPTILTKGIHYHNNAAIGEWIGYGNPPMSWTFESGINFAPHMKAIFHGDMAHRVFLARVVQGASMLLLLTIGLVMYKRWKGRMNYYDLLLVMLYNVIMFFFLFGPLTYRYYYLPLFMIAACVLGRILIAGRSSPQEAK